MTDELNFKVWRRQVSAILIDAVGLSVGDLPDGMWRDYFDDELSPMEAIEVYCEDSDDMGLGPLLRELGVLS